jgi:hypothetical protein
MNHTAANQVANEARSAPYHVLGLPN